MRNKLFVMSMGLAASVWLTGCQSSNSLRPIGSSPLRADAGLKSSEKQTRVASRPATKSATSSAAKTLAARPPAPVETAQACSSCSKCGGKCGETAHAAASPNSPPTCSSCAAKASHAMASATPLAIPTTIPQGSSITPTAMNVPANIPANIPMPSALPQAPPVGVPSLPLPNGANEIVAVQPPAVAMPVVSSYGPGVEVVSGQPAATPTISVPGERTVQDNVMTVRFGQANNYQVVVGQVYQFRRTWRLRFSAVESDDKYGGSFTLVGDNLDNLKDGQMVRVEGMVQPSDDRVAGARYQVNRVEVLEPDVK